MATNKKQHLLGYNDAKVPPQNTKAEISVLGLVMQFRELFEQVNLMLRPEHFYNTSHEIVYRACVKLYKQSKPIDVITVAEVIVEEGNLETVGGLSYLSSLTNNVDALAISHIDQHVKIIIEKFISRRLILLCSTVVEKAYQNNDCFDLADNVLIGVEKLLAVNALEEISSLLDCSTVFIQNLDNKIAKKEDINGVPSGFREIDHCTAGWQKTDLIILAARPSVGKSAFCINLAVNAAFSPQEIPVAVFSLEMSKEQITERIYSERSRLSLADLRRGKIDVQQRAVIAATQKKIENGCIYIDDTGAIDWMQVRVKVKRIIQTWKRETKFREHGKGLIIIDYLQLMSDVNDGQPKNREQQISSISRNLKLLAKEIDQPVIALSQLSRGLETQKREPVLSDLRDSGAIEQDADVVMFIYRPENDTNIDSGETLFKIAKHRNGTLERFKLIGKMNIQKFFNPYDPELDNIPGSNHTSTHYVSAIQPNLQFDDGYNVEEEFSFKKPINKTNV